MGEVQDLNGTLILDSTICLLLMYTSSGQDEDGKDFTFYFDIKHLKDSAPVEAREKKGKDYVASQFERMDVEAKGFNPGLIVLLLVGGPLLFFLVGNYVLYMYAQKTLPLKKKKPISKKKMKKERLKQGVSAPGE
ncbi:DNA-binding S1FA-like [Olea europaea subsp. europaea]|uniref:DNA-binding S1FA-like n=1 Tax=Olea europaea subsp. europaea TaxID=158383 RepID=A0A8S0UPY5_OLEEU|nr:DNA-binding S1FA-like [Olea europaea subsp. europaea]